MVTIDIETPTITPTKHDYEGVDTQLMRYGIESHEVASVGLLSSPAETMEYVLSIYQLEAKRLALKNERLAWEMQKLSENYQGLERQAQVECKKAEQALQEAENLRQSERLKTELVSNIAHELRTPLASIKGFTTALLQSGVRWNKETRRDFLQTIDQETDRLTRLISDLLDMSRLEARALSLEKDDYQISEILGSVSRTLAKLTEHHQLQVIVLPGLPSVFVDQMRIGQVLTNLVENAAKYSRKGSQITIESQLAGDKIMVSVADRGEGIPGELLDRVFDRFYRVESAVRGRRNGTGLGLSICRGLIETHDGKIWVESEAGKGSKFSFSLPVSKREKEVA